MRVVSLHHYHFRVNVCAYNLPLFGDLFNFSKNTSRTPSGPQESLPPSSYDFAHDPAATSRPHLFLIQLQTPVFFPHMYQSITPHDRNRGFHLSLAPALVSIID